VNRGLKRAMRQEESKHDFEGTPGMKRHGLSAQAQECKLSWARKKTYEIGQKGKSPRGALGVAGGTVLRLYVSTGLE